MTADLSQNSSPSSYRRTKIVATLGPATKSPEKIRELINTGVNVFRLNFSHGSHEEHLTTLLEIRKASTELRKPVAVLQDLAGPKIRITPVDGDFVTIQDGATVELRKGKGEKSSDKEIFVESLDPVKILKSGEQLLLADGLIVLQAKEVTSTHVVCGVVKGGRLRSRVGIAFPDSIVDLPATTDKDLIDLEWGIEHKVDFVAISFVQSASDVRRLQEIIRSKGGEIGVIAKIERKVALEHIVEITEACDGLMVARGDLGLELPLEKVPSAQKRLIELGNSHGVPVIVATQMLHSMVTSVRPTRAEVSDVATAVMTGADAVMLSEETAIGANPIESVSYLSRIAVEAEKNFEFEEFKRRLHLNDQTHVPEAVAYAACAAAVKVHAAAIIACTQTGHSARLVAKFRPQQPLFGASTNERTLSRMCLYWGIIPIRFDQTKDHYDEIDMALKVVQKRQNIPAGSQAVIIGGLSVGKPGSTSVLEVREF